MTSEESEELGKRTAAEDDAPREVKNLRKRKSSLKGFVSIDGTSTCKFQSCGIQFKDLKALEWHYEGHFSQELSKLSKLRIKKNAKDFPDRTTKSLSRREVLEKIRARRQTRISTPISERVSSDARGAQKCPICDQEIADEEWNDDESSDEERISSIYTHMETCISERTPTGILLSSNNDDNVDVDGTDGFEEYEWAGQRRIRATSLFEGNLRGAGFLTIEKGEENDILDIENDHEEAVFGKPQYTDRDVILPSAETKEEEESRARLREATLGKSTPTSRNDNGTDEENDTSSMIKPRELSRESLEIEFAKLQKALSTMQHSSMCNICMDSYSIPVVSVVCWHVHCEECWLRSLGAKKVCPQCKIITRPEDLRKIFL